MADPLRTSTPRPPDGLSSAERDSRIEQLLLTGLDHYFAGEYEHAISIWTRVLFLDRSHARARAYIERARGAVAERQRESEELLHRGMAAFNRGDSETARELLMSVVERSGPHDVALAYLDRLDRLELVAAQMETVNGGAAPAVPTVAVSRRAPGGRTPRRRWVLVTLLLAAGGFGGFYVAASWERLEPVLSRGGPWSQMPASGAPQLPEEPLPVPRPAEIALSRARAQFLAGHLKDATRQLEAISVGDPLQREATALRVEIQRALLAAVAGTSAVPAARPAGTSAAPPSRAAPRERRYR